MARTVASLTDRVRVQRSDGALIDPATETTLASVLADLAAILTKLNASLAVTGPLTDTQMRASAVPISGAVTVSDGSGPLTVDGTVAVSNLPATQAVTGPLTDTQLRASAVPISGSVTVSDGTGPLTVDGTVSVGNFPATQAVSGTVTASQGAAAAHGSAWEATDYYTSSEVLPDFPGVNAVHDFTFTGTPKLIWVLSRGGVSRAAFGSQTPTATFGVYCDDGIPNPIAVQAQTMHLYVPSGVTVTVYGLS